MRADSTPGRRAVTVRLASIGLLAAGVAEGAEFVTPVPRSKDAGTSTPRPAPPSVTSMNSRAPARQLEWFEHSGHNPWELDRFSGLDDRHSAGASDCPRDATLVIYPDRPLHADVEPVTV